MNLLVISDIRGSEEIPEMVDIDIICLLGKVPSKIIDKLESVYTDIPIIGVLSNSYSTNHYENTRVVNIHKKIVEIDGLRFAGFGGALQESNESNGYYTEEEVAQFITALAASEVDILLSYSNLAYADINLPNSSTGFKAYNRIIMEDIVPVVLHGRLQSDFTRQLGNTVIHSVYPYKVINIQN